MPEDSRPKESDAFIVADAPSLSDVSPRDKPWDKHRGNADTVEGHYRGTEFDRYAERIDTCSQLIQFRLVPDGQGTYGLKLSAARFCRVRHCPVCQWRRSLMWKAKAYKILPKVVEDYPTHRWLFLTLTIRNCEITALRQTLQEMNRGFKRLTELKAWPAEGWIKSVEVTRGKRGDAHPHFHILLMVPASYFGRNYLKQSAWVQMWRKSMRLDYNPIMDIRPVKRGEQPMSLIPELLKYCVKESDLTRDRAWFLELTRQMHRQKGVVVGGVLRDYLRALEDEPEDLIGEGDEAEVDEGKLTFGWRRIQKKYRLRD